MILDKDGKIKMGMFQVGSGSQDSHTDTIDKIIANYGGPFGNGILAGYRHIFQSPPTDAEGIPIATIENLAEDGIFDIVVAPLPEEFKSRMPPLSGRTYSATVTEEGDNIVYRITPRRCAYREEQSIHTDEQSRYQRALDVAQEMARNFTLFRNQARLEKLVGETDTSKMQAKKLAILLSKKDPNLKYQQIIILMNTAAGLYGRSDLEMDSDSLLGHLPVVKINQKRISFYESAYVTYSSKEGSEDNNKRLLCIEGVELKGYTTGGNCPTLVAFVGIKTRQRHFGGGTCQMKEPIYIPVDFVLGYQPLVTTNLVPINHPFGRCT